MTPKGLVALLGAAVLFVTVAAPFADAQTPAKKDPENANRTLVWIPKTVNSTFWLAVWEGTKKAATELGYKEVLYKGTAAQSDIAGQVNLVNDMVSRKVSGIMIAATDAKALVDPVEKAVAAGVPVVTLDSGVDSQKPYAYIATDNIAAAKTAADVLGGLIGSKGTVGDIGITAGSQTGREREDGFVKQMKAKHPEVKILAVQYTGCDPAKSLNIATDMLTGNPGLVGFYGQDQERVLRRVARSVPPVPRRLPGCAHRPGSVPDGVPRRVRDGPGHPQAAGQGQAGRHPGEGRHPEEHQPA